MGAVDFSEWATPTLDVTLKGRTFHVQPPSVEAAKQVLAAAVRGEMNLKGSKDPLPEELQAVLDTIEPDSHPALGDAYGAMVLAGVDPHTIDRVAYYAVFYWAYGKQYADGLATILWAPRVTDIDPDEGMDESGVEGNPKDL